MKITISGQSYEHPSRDANYQRSVNLFPAATGDPVVQSVQLHTPGLTELVDLSGNEVRAIMPFDDKLYVIVDETVYLVTLAVDQNSATSSSIGTLTNSTGRISWARNPTQIMLVDGSTNGYVITASTDTLAAISDTDFTGGVTVNFIDSYFVYNTPDSATMFSTDSNDGTTIDALDVATAEASPDQLKAIIVDKREIWAVGETTTEVWYNAANPIGFPFSTRDGAVVDQGTSAAHSVIKADNTLLWLDDRRFVVQKEGYSINIVSTDVISAEFQTYATVSDAFAFAFKDRGHYFYQLTFPTEGKTWVYDLTSKMWHEKSFRNPATDMDTRHLANCFGTFQDLSLVGAFNSGKLYKMSSEYFDDAGDPILRIRTTSHTTTELKQYSVNALELHAETGKGTVSGAGSDPQVMLRYSNDGGYTWSHSLPRSLGKLGEYDKRVRWNRLGTGREWIFEFTIADPVPLGLLELYAEIDGDGNA
jgi:hypothetical protein